MLTAQGNKKLYNQNKMEIQALNSKALNLIMEARHEFFRKDDQRKNLHNPLYLWQHGYVPDTPLMRVVVKDIMFCGYQYQPINSDNYLVSDGTDYEKLKRIFSYDYGVDIDVERYFACHRLFRLMQYIEQNVSEEHRKAVLDREQQAMELGKQLFQLLCDCCEGRSPRLDSNPAFLDLDFKKFEEKLYKQYHMLFSPYERRQLNSIYDILRHLIFRLRDGGRL